jgi:hypothetical protein
LTPLDLIEIADRRCNRKKAQPQGVAENAALEMTKRHHELFEAYQCQDCGAWHVAHASYTTLILELQAQEAKKRKGSTAVREWKASRSLWAKKNAESD